jgi:uncharacterized protein YwlG (UPF0340 family)
LPELACEHHAITCLNATFANHHIFRLETIAAIPGFVAGGTLHLNTLRSMYDTVLT